MVTHIYNKVVVRVFSYLLPLTSYLLTGCADLDYTEETTRDEAWTYEYFENGIKNLVFDVYAQVYNNEFEANSAYFLAGATDEAQYALETGAVNNYVKIRHLGCSQVLGAVIHGEGQLERLSHDDLFGRVGSEGDIFCSELERHDRQSQTGEKK